MRIAAGLATLSLLVLCAGGELAHAQGPVASESALKAAYIYHFVQFTEWPGSALARKPTIDICVAESSPLRQDIAALAGQPAHGKPIRVRTYETSPPGDCDVVIVRDLALASALPAPGNVLTIAEIDAPGALDAVIVALVVDERRVSFSINKQLAAAANLAISSKLLRLARSVK